mmetsp:Transcript_25342/g.22378  ORF Transcript_25342/g.22378 Transcript_25342/m.22378 type:complete len:150 (-) Transcript_25342:270-719(-)|eukprot:CAMPEP_0114582382 /NCGR_PEP_ID=MMETSP0125-20121206/6381_1 /TAXON_ID=485358 ORGANISM="Aristerostoma sp., Strain ATCC 50986" /NCGR_SAMPLE_ID=MMETSP0125 /ASSEMBLY_ACC=CAM_ASM_000245 /LENGTH=149 /DNA_ID=CAMNT_0001775315 /DNA_START=82 /DNA_END=531 /DNA_ORIENTATION=+
MSGPTPRILKETQKLGQEKVQGIETQVDDKNYRHFYVKIYGPGNTPYEGGIFNAELLLPDEYPMSPPKVIFCTKIYHPNIDNLGRICLDILKDKWSPALQIRSVLLSIQALLSSPNPDDPLNNEAANLWKTNESAAIKKAKEYTQNYAK